MYRILFIILFFPTLVFSHELKPSIADFKFKKKNEFLNFNLKIRLNLEAILANIDPSHEDTDESKNKDYYDYLRSLDSKKLKIVFNKTLKDFQNNMLILQSGKKINFQIDKVDIGNIGDLNISRETIIFISGENIGKDNLRLGWTSDYGPIILRVANLDGEIVYTEYLKNSLISKSFSIEKKYSNLFNEITKYLIIGFQHIFPKGIDHILFVLGLFLFSPKFKPLFIQISVFTIAHTITIFLGVLNIIRVSETIVEPIIALSISYVAMENIFLKKISIWRPLIIFFFGLLHGLGFAGVINEIGLSQTNFIFSLLAFNLGVEIGQLFVIVICYFGVTHWIKDRLWYKKFFTNPMSLIISIIGLIWFVERIM